MTRNDELLEQGPREAPEPDTAEQRSKKLGLKTAGGGVAAGGIGLAKAGILGKTLIWLFAWNGISTGWRIGGWVGLAIAIGVIATYIALRHRRAQG